MLKLNWATYKHIVVLTGAGISAASGIATFRGSGGLWENHRIEDVATPEAFARDPELVWRFYSMRRAKAGEAKPNAAHRALDHFAAAFAGQFTLITQNVDGLHRRAGITSHLEPLCMHGTLEKSRCTHCDQIYWDDFIWLPEVGQPRSSQMLDSTFKASPDALEHYRVETKNGMPLSPCCQALLRPHIVWFGEHPLSMSRITSELEHCDVFVSIGTSGQVYPAAAFIEVAKSHGAKTVVLNLEPLPQQLHVDEYIEGPSELTVPAFFKLS